MTRVLFIGGLGHSGTTLIERVLGELPGICPLGEVSRLWRPDLPGDLRCGCGDLLGECGFWRAVSAQAYGGWDRALAEEIIARHATARRAAQLPALATGWLSPGRRAELTALAGQYARLYAAAADISGAAVVVDSSRDSALAHCLRFAPELDLRVVHVVRDPRAVAHARASRVTRITGDAGSAERGSPAHSAALWNAGNAAFGLLRRRGVPVRRVRYEDLLADPRRTLTQLAAFACRYPTAAELRFLGRTHADLGPAHSAGGDPVRFTVGRVRLHPDDAWQTELAWQHQALIETICAPLLRLYGYPAHLRRRPAGAGAPAQLAPRRRAFAHVQPAGRRLADPGRSTKPWPVNRSHPANELVRKNIP